jgi:hypothetical protein
MSTQVFPAQAKELFHYLFEQASLGIAVEDLEGKLLLANPALCSMLGFVLDLDATDIPLYGHQPERSFHGYYDSYCYLPLYIFAGDQLLCARVRPANQDAAAGSVEELVRIVTQFAAVLAGGKDRRHQCLRHGGCLLQRLVGGDPRTSHSGKTPRTIDLDQGDLPVGKGPNDVGSARYHLTQACEGSLKRLGTELHRHLPYAHPRCADACRRGAVHRSMVWCTEVRSATSPARTSLAGI